MGEVELSPGRWVGEGRQVYIVAEIGQNHQGQVDTARKMIAAAAEAGADCVKFQKSCLKEKFTRGALGRAYTGAHSWGETYGEHKKYLELSEEDYRELQSFAESLSIDFTASAMDPVSAAFLDNINVPFIKIGSGDVNNLGLHTQVAKTRRPMVVSTGMSSMAWVRTVHENIRRHSDKLVLLQCTSSYPTRPEDVNLKVLERYRREFPSTVVGYSGHEEGLAISLAAIHLGAALVERHFTLDPNQKGSDHQCSLEPAHLAELVRLARQRPGLGTLRELLPGEAQAIHSAMGSTEKVVLASELPCKRKLGKTLVASREIKKGEVISSEDVVLKVAEPPGCDPCHLDYLGLVAATDIMEDHGIPASQLTHMEMHLVQTLA